jgi:hypothetical protein
MIRRKPVEVRLVIFCLALLFLVKISYYVDVNFGVRFEDCNIPDYEPFHPSVMEYLKDPPPLNCSKFQFALTFVDSDRTIHVNASAVNELKKLNSNVTDVKCYYKAISRTVDESEDHDVSVDFSKDEVMQFNCLL